MRGAPSSDPRVRRATPSLPPPSSQAASSGPRRLPFVGPRPFLRDDVQLFGGRGTESEELVSLIFANPAVLLYARSGVGKTSLLNAGVIPLLEQEDAVVFGGIRVSGVSPQTVSPPSGVSIFALHACMSLERDRTQFASLSSEPITDFLTSWKPAQPASPPRLRVLIFDQFEELFTTSVERWKDREPFFDDLREALNRDSSLRIVFSMREEHVAATDKYAPCLPGRLKARYRLDGLDHEEAKESFRKPLREVGKQLGEPFVEAVVANLLRTQRSSDDGKEEYEAEFVEPLHIQLVGSRLWANWPEQEGGLTAEFAKAHGDIESALREHCANAVADVAAKASKLHANGTLKEAVSESTIRAWLERKLITPLQTRALVLKERNYTADMPNAVVTALENKHHLLRGEARAGALWIELAHDRLIAPIRDSNREWVAKNDGGPINGAALEASRQAWESAREGDFALLPAKELADAERWLKGPIATEFGVSELLHRYIQASRDAVRLEEARKLEEQRARETTEAEEKLAREAAETSAKAERKRKQQTLQLGGLGFAAVLVVGWILNGKYRAEQGRLELAEQTSEQFRLAANDLKQREETKLKALEFAIRAALPQPGFEPSAQVTQDLQTVLSDLGRGTPLLSGPGPIPPSSIVVTPDGTRVFAIIARSPTASDVCAWKTAEPWSRKCASPPPDWMWETASTWGSQGQFLLVSRVNPKERSGGMTCFASASLVKRSELDAPVQFSGDQQTMFSPTNDGIKIVRDLEHAFTQGDPLAGIKPAPNAAAMTGAPLVFSRTGEVAAQPRPRLGPSVFEVGSGKKVAHLGRPKDLGEAFDTGVPLLKFSTDNAYLISLAPILRDERPTGDWLLVVWPTRDGDVGPEKTIRLTFAANEISQLTNVLASTDRIAVVRWVRQDLQIDVWTLPLLEPVGFPDADLDRVVSVAPRNNEVLVTRAGDSQESDAQVALLKPLESGAKLLNPTNVPPPWGQVVASQDLSVLVTISGPVARLWRGKDVERALSANPTNEELLRFGCSKLSFLRSPGAQPAPKKPGDDTKPVDLLAEACKHEWSGPKQ
jgi:hypothetical protein